MPASSRNSRSADALGGSPMSAQPPGSVQPPSTTSRTSRTFPSRTSAPRTSTFGVGMAGAVRVESRALAGDLGGQPRDLLVARDVVVVGGVREARLRHRLQPPNPVDPGLHSRYRRGFVPQFLDIEQSVLLLELEPPFDKRAVQLARRRMAKRWHPDIAPPGRQHEHERHLKAINEAADQLERLAEDSRGGKVSRNAVKVSAAGRAQGARRGGAARTTRPSSAPARTPPTARSTTRSPRACPTTRSCTATRAACPIPSGASAASTASTSPATATTSSSGRASPSRSACARCRRARCSSSTSRSPTPAPSASSAS